MINLMVKSIAENSNKIDSIAKYVSKMNKCDCVIFLLLTADIYFVSKVVKSNKERIEALEAELEGIKSTKA